MNSEHKCKCPLRKESSFPNYLPKKITKAQHATMRVEIMTATTMRTFLSGRMVGPENNVS